VIYLQRHAICFTTAFYRYYYLLFFRHTLTIRMIANLTIASGHVMANHYGFQCGKSLSATVYSTDG